MNAMLEPPPADRTQADLRGLPAIKCEHLRKVVGRETILHGIDLEVWPGEAVAIVGPSGSGKSTLLRCLNWLSPPTSGRVWLGSEAVGSTASADDIGVAVSASQRRQLRRQIGMVFQSFNLWPHMTALQNVREPLRHVKHLQYSEADRVARETLAAVGLGPKVDAYPRQLSGGQQQRVAIARAIAARPEVLLMDEPTSALDPELVGEVLSVMRRLAQERTTMIIVTHEIAFAREACDRIVFMDGGRIVEEGPTQVLLSNPRHARTQQFLNHFNNRQENP